MNRTINIQIENVKDRIINKFASDTSSKHRAITKVTRRVLLDAPYLLNNELWEVNARSLGAGVYELSLEKQN